MTNEQNEQMSKSPERSGFVWFGEGWPAAEVAARLRALFKGGPGYWLSYRADRTHFERWDPEDNVQQVNLWPEGRVFGPALELRWERRGTGYAAWLLAEEKPSQENLAGLQLVGGQWQVEEYNLTPIFLWGSYNQDEGCWVEVKLPQFQEYPVTPPSEKGNTEKLFARLQSVYYQTKSGAVQFTRLKGVE